MDARHFFASGWIRFPYDDAIAHWAAQALPVAEVCVADTEQRARWMRCGGTWFVGVHAFPNDARGSVPDAGVPPLEGLVIDFIDTQLGLDTALDRAQISACFPGYPQPSADEPAAAFRFRRDRDGAHVDGFRRAEGGRRRLGELHGCILGVPLTDAPADAAPLVVWDGSHEIMRRALRTRLADVAPVHWQEQDVTDAYVAARRECFEHCRRVAVHARPGEAYVIHRLALHGMAPWTAPMTGSRIVAYFRPDPRPPGAEEEWLYAN